MARAVYSSAKHVLLDDCLSAVDSHTAVWIYENCITGPLMKNRTCILVTHNVSLTLRNAHFAIVLENGRVKNQGTITELQSKGLFKENYVQFSSRDSINEKNANRLKAPRKNDSQKIEPVTENINFDANFVNDDQLIEEEEKSNGAISLDVYKWYLKFFGGFKALTVLFALYITAQILFISQSWWIRH